MHGDWVSASFFAPWSRRQEPYIRIATGDYAAMEVRRGRDSALAAFIVSLSHEVIHYHQWVASGRMTEAGTAAGARSMLHRYMKSVDHP
jgi:hypothetical protein